MVDKQYFKRHKVIRYYQDMNTWKIEADRAFFFASEEQALRFTNEMNRELHNQRNPVFRYIYVGECL